MRATHSVHADLTRPLMDDSRSGHNRWHPGIAPVARVVPGESISIDLRDGLDGQATETNPPKGAAPSFDFSRSHPLTGPIEVVGAAPGDLVTIEFLEIAPASFGFTGVRPGGGLLGDEISEGFIARWAIKDGFARSDDIPGVAIRGTPFVGVVGVAPSEARLRAFTARETELASRGGRATLPEAKGAVPVDGPAATEGLRTIPPRETGGNLDIKYLQKGARLTLPVDVPGALVSFGDAHFAQGNGEICSQAIEMAARIVVQLSLIKKGDVQWRPRYPVLHVPAETSPAPLGERLLTVGLPIDVDGRNYDMDLRLAAREALREMMAYLVEERGYTRSQAYVICSVAVDLEISEAVNGSNGLVSAVLPLDIFRA